MRGLCVLSLSVFFCGVAASANAGTIVLNFDAVAPAGALESKEAGPGYEYTENGFGLDVEDVFFPELHFVTSGYAAGGNYINHSSDYAVTNFGLKFTLAREGGGLFDAVSLKASHDTDAAPAINIAATGFFADGTFVQQTFTTNAGTGFETLLFNPQFKDLLSLEFDADSWMAYDDITLTIPNAVPEPTSAASTLLGLAFLVAIAGRLNSLRTIL